VTDHATPNENGYDPEALAAAQDAIDRGDATEAWNLMEAEADRVREARAAQATEYAAASTPTTGRTSRGTTVEIPAATAIAADLLVADGLSREEALQRLVDDRQATLSDLGNRIKQRQTQIVNEASLAEDEAFAASPAGRLAAAEQAADEAAARERVIAQARQLLKKENPGEAALMDQLPAEDILDLAGIELKPETIRKREEERLMNDPAVQRQLAQQRAVAELRSKWWTLHPSERKAEAVALGLNAEDEEARQWAQAKARGHA
jgi:3D (Asp-Asp-Asp) domain-containing protein